MKYFIFSITLFLILLGSSDAFTQVNKKVKIVLINGVKINDAVIKSFNEEALEIYINNSDPLVIRYGRIKKINFKDYGSLQDDVKDKLKLPPSLETNAFFHEVKGSLLFGEDNLGFALQTINGYQFNRYIGTGLGLGVNKYGNYLAMPIYANIKGYIYDKKVSPFYFGDVGYGFAWNTNSNENFYNVDNVEGGLYWQVGMGYQFNFYNSALVLSLGYINQHSKADYVYYDQWGSSNIEVNEKRILRRFAFSVGFSF